jgi:three-Cys-motif partner protein
MVSVHDYVGREQSYIKHVLLDSYLEVLAHKTASTYRHIVYVDGFAGPWQSANERFEDTSFGIALNAIRRAKESWRQKHRDVRMSAFLVDPSNYQQLARIPQRYPDVEVRTYNDDFMVVLPEILQNIPSDAFTFFLVDPKGWKIRLLALEALLARPKSEVVFNFMFNFINRAASIKDVAVVSGLNELIPFGDWRSKLESAEQSGDSTPELRKAILIEGFSQSLRELGNYNYVAETTILRPLEDRPLYCLFYATRHPKGIEVFRRCQVDALREQSKTRAATKAKHTAMSTGQAELFESLHDMGPDNLNSFLQTQRIEAEKTLLELAPERPHFLVYERLWTQVLARLVVTLPDVNKIAARLYREKRLLIPDWENGKHVPHQSYRIQRAE